MSCSTLVLNQNQLIGGVSQGHHKSTGPFPCGEADAEHVCWGSQLTTKLRVSKIQMDFFLTRILFEPLEASMNDKSTQKSPDPRVCETCC